LMTEIKEKLGLIAGNGTFPFLVLDAARAQGYDVVVAAIKEEENQTPAQVKAFTWDILGMLKRAEHNE